MKNATLLFIIFGLMYGIVSCGSNEKKNVEKKPETASLEKKSNMNTVKQYTVSVVRTFPHDTLAYTQGLEYHDGFFYESTGQYSTSSLRKLDTSFNVIKKIPVAAQFFAEGLSIFDNNIYQLTWQSGICLVYDLKTMKMKKTFNYQGEGWGLTNDGTSLIMSDGTNILRYINPSDFSIQKTVIVHDEGMNPVNNLNELEFINGEIWANIWMTDNIVRIDPKSGTITGWVDLTPLHQAITPNSNIDVLNGIAFEKSSGQIFLSGKNWPKIFEVKVVEKN